MPFVIAAPDFVTAAAGDLENLGSALGAAHAAAAPATTGVAAAAADETPRIGYLAPTDYQQLMDRLIDWVAFTPLQNVTGEPAISLPLTQSADGMPVGMMLSADMGQESLLLERAYDREEARPWARIQAG